MNAPQSPVATLREFLDRVETVRTEWGLKNEDELWFRGEEREFPTRLMPTLWRTGTDANKILREEDRIYDEFRSRAVHLRPHSCDDGEWAWDAYFLMQQHGAPTRILDWTDSSLVALHFAVRGRWSAQSGHGDAFVYVLNVRETIDRLKPKQEKIEKRWKELCCGKWDLREERDDWEWAWLPDSEEDREDLDIPDFPFLCLPFHLSRRMAGQRWQPMILGKDREWLTRKVEGGKADRELVRAIPIAGEAIQKIRWELRWAGMTESLIFPDLDGLGRELAQRWDDLFQAD